MDCVGKISLMRVTFLISGTYLAGTVSMSGHRDRSRGHNTYARRPVGRERKRRHALHLVIRLVLAELAPELVERRVLRRVFANSAMPGRPVLRALRTRGRLHDLVKRLALLPGLGRLQQGLAEREDRLLRRQLWCDPPSALGGPISCGALHTRHFHWCYGQLVVARHGYSGWRRREELGGRGAEASL